MLSNLSYKFALHFITENNEIGVQKDNELHIQGLFNLADNRAQDGGFVLVPRFHSIFSNFFSQHRATFQKYGSGRFIVLPAHLEQSLKPIRITLRKGSIVLWDQRVAHGSQPNNSGSARYAQFFKMFPASSVDPERFQRRSRSIQKRILATSPSFQPSHLGQFTLGLLPFPPS